MVGFDFRYGSIEDAGHRPWPVPDGPWVMTQTWRDLLFAHWPVAREALAALVPAAFPIDTFDGTGWLGVVPFVMTNVAPRGLPRIPTTSSFPELNVRTYVRVDDKPGVFFFSLDAGSALAAWAGRALLGLPYFHARMRAEGTSSPSNLNRDGIRYESVRRTRGSRAELRAEYAPVGPSFVAVPGSLEYFLAERYCLYALDRRGRPVRLDIHHSPWPLQPAEAAIAVNTMATAAGLALPDVAPVLHFARRQDTVVWLPRAI